MLISTETKIKWNSKVHKHYVELGYKYTKMGEEFTVAVKDLTQGSNARVQVKCDYCGEIYETKYCNYLKRHKNILQKDACFKVECYENKQHEIIKAKYNVKNICELDAVRKKALLTNMKKYGVPNVFQNKEIQKKIRETNLKKYGVENPVKTKGVQEKIKRTCLERYGVPCYLNLDFSGEKNSGKNNPRWKGGSVFSKRPDLDTHEYYIWRKTVFEKNHFVCQCCGKKGGYLEAHHIFNYADYPDLRLSVDNGITLCKECHKQFHKKYGKRNNTKKQIEEFIKK